MKNKTDNNVLIYDDYNSRIPKDQKAIGTLTTQCGDSAVRHGYKIIIGKNKMEEAEFAIRKLTPRECFRFMDVREKDIDRMLSVNSNSQCYKQAGNSIVVSCLCGIFSQLGIKNVNKWNDKLDGGENIGEQIFNKEWKNS